MKSAAGTNQAIMKIPLSHFISLSLFCCNFLFVWTICPKLIKPASKLNPPHSVTACHSRIGLKLILSLLLSLFLSLSLSVFSVFAQVSQLRNCLHPTQSGAGLKFPIGYVPICREHTSTDAIREQAYELPGSLPSLSSDRMALIPDYDPNNNTTTTWKPKQLGAGKGFIIYILMDLLTKPLLPPQKLKCHISCQQSRDFRKIFKKARGKKSAVSKSRSNKLNIRHCWP